MSVMEQLQLDGTSPAEYAVVSKALRLYRVSVLRKRLDGRLTELEATDLLSLARSVGDRYKFVPDGPDERQQFMSVYDAGGYGND